MARIVLLCSLVLLALLYLGIWFGAYKYLKNKKVDGVSLLDSAVNESKDTSKIPLNELIVYFLMIAIAVSGAIKLMHGAGSGFSIMARWIIGPPALALFNGTALGISYDSFFYNRPPEQSADCINRWHGY